MATPDIDQDYDAFLKALAGKIKGLRKKRGLTLRDMVIKYGYHDSQWRRMERDGVGGLHSLIKIAKVFDISLSELLDELGSFPKNPLPKPLSKEVMSKKKRSSM